MTLRLEQAEQEAKKKDVSEQKAAQELKRSKDDLQELKNAFEKVSDELKRIKIEVRITRTKCLRAIFVAERRQHVWLFFLGLRLKRRILVQRLDSGFICSMFDCMFVLYFKLITFVHITIQHYFF